MEDNTELRVVQLNREAERLHLAGETQEALRVAREALGLAVNLGKDHRLYAQCMNDLGAILSKSGDMNQAEKLSLQALEIRRRTLGTQHADFAESLCNYGMVMKGLKRFGEAELHIRQAMDFFRASAGEKDPSFIICRNSLAAVFRESGNPAAAEELLRPAIEARKEEKQEAPREIYPADRGMIAEQERHYILDGAVFLSDLPQARPAPSVPPGKPSLLAIFRKFRRKR